MRRARDWALFLLINVVTSTLTALIVVRSLHQLFIFPLESAAAPAAIAPAPGRDIPPTTTTDTDMTATTVEPSPPPTAPSPAPTASPESRPSPAATNRTDVIISAVVFPGQRNREMVVLVNQGDNVDLSGWTLSNSRGKVYTFGSVVLLRDSYINLHTSRGADLPTDLFWNLDEAVWRSGDTAILKQGDTVIASYVVP